MKAELMTSTLQTMRAVVFDGELNFVKDYPVPEAPAGWALIRVQKVGICGTDLELIKGYRNFTGIPGHEFVGTVLRCDASEWRGKTVVGDINIGCNRCDWCLRGLQRHCPNRKVLGILNHDGCMADYCILPVANLYEIPENVTADRLIFTEPLSAACEILEQLTFHGNEQVVVLGDGRLGILCAWILATVFPDVTLVGHHPKKLALAEWRHLKTVLSTEAMDFKADIVVDATGSKSGMITAISLCRPRGTIVLKSTVASKSEIDLSSVVVNELTVAGSRCGQFKDGFRMLESYPDMPVERLITARYPIEESLAAFTHAAQQDAVKILLEIPEKTG